VIYQEEDYLLLSGLQHFAFCRRQWALIHLEQLWEENYRTIDGQLLHEKAHDAQFRESRGDRIITRGVSVYSPRLGVSGQCDILEYHQSSSGIPMAGRDGLWQPFPVEYKRGAPKQNTDADFLQLCGQAMCLEDMLCCEIPEGAIYYGQTRHRQNVVFTQELRNLVEEMLAQMHQLYQRRHTPKAKPSKSCNACSLKDLCLPKLTRKKSASAYLNAAMEEQT